MTTTSENETRHTPGPWSVGETSANEGEGRFILGEGGYVAVTVRGEGDSAREDEANARLLAAAPSLLEALRENEKLLAAYVNHEEVEMCAFAERLEAVRAAIADVEGEGI